MINLAETHYLPILVILGFLLGMPAAIVNFYELRNEIVRTDEIRTGHYDQVPNVPKFYRRYFREALRHLFEYTKYEFDFFVSYKSFPDKNNAALLVSFLRQNHPVAFIDKNLDVEPLIEKKGHGTGLYTYIEQPISRSSIVVLLYSENTLSSFWVCLEFVNAMNRADLVLILNKSEVDAETITNEMNNSISNWTLKAPTFIKDIAFDSPNSYNYFLNYAILSQQLSLIANERIQRKKFYYDVLSITTQNMLFSFLLLFGFYHNLLISKEVFTLFLLSASLFSAFIYPCRAKYPKRIIESYGFKKVYTGLNIDYPRIERTFYETIFLIVIVWVQGFPFYVVLQIILIAALFVTPRRIHRMLQHVAIAKVAEQIGRRRRID